MAYRQIVLGALFLTGMTAAAAASPRDDVLAGISRCTGLADERTFLDCVYGAAQPVRAELGLPPAPASQTRLVPAARPAQSAVAPVAAANTASQPDQRGVMDRLFAEGTVVAPPQAMKSYNLDANGYFTVTLSNGQIWRQVAGDTMVHWNRSASDYSVMVESGAAGSFNLEVVGEGGLYKVTRAR